MKYFLPYWEDWVHADFDPISDTYSKGGFKNSIFAHELLETTPYDGILVSLGMFKLKLKLIKRNGKPSIRGYQNIKKYLRVPENFPVIGDCGAFTYVNEKEPKISVEEAIYHYESLKFDYGISVDHICSETIVVEKEKVKLFSFKEAKESKDKIKLFLSEKELELRRQTSIENAWNFLKLSKGKNFIPVGAVQGYTIETYLDSAKKLIDYGYEYLAIGGLVPRKTEFISELLDRLYKEFDTEKIKIHLLGVLREELLTKMIKYNIYSFDSASYYRKAWLRAAQNYLGVDGKWYASIRVPDCHNIRLRKKILSSGLSFPAIEKMEQKILKGLRDYDKGTLKEVDCLLEEIMNYDKLFFRDDFKEEKYSKLYKELLESRVWKECSCEICSKLGIDVVIFRGSNRNKRRGFHNTLMFYRKFRALLEKQPTKVVY
ncbi:queuine/other tRNA-ribosyltransferase [Desulfurobacterium thermolithotrophum DSM 11699]|uniref:Queuine/other tRNA-ribosyltransferase n=1 Tax=Desulfurobacterium thermolithotrophum (strain DSM 11699 / BSA) TaxID=868864 RepID=F0S2D6_DESTD|nr:tRNA-guanine transglycosylase DpdA [Desulfurobacterium thermolithotrophum]ADY74151.1 queuine/other tRNA-ribosyltransferase [Desulfurobacterium thermolithotrophum DSM 11699]